MRLGFVVGGIIVIIVAVIIIIPTYYYSHTIACIGLYVLGFVLLAFGLVTTRKPHQIISPSGKGSFCIYCGAKRTNPNAQNCPSCGKRI